MNSSINKKFNQTFKNNMKKSNSISKKNPKLKQKVSVNDPSILLAKFFNGVVIQFDERFIYES